MKTIILALLLFTILACDRAKSEYPFVGKWAGLSTEEYVETLITTDTIYGYSMHAGSFQPIHFEVKRDSLHYSTYNMVVGYQMINDSILVIGNMDFSDTLYKLDQSIIMFEEFNHMDTAGIRKYESEFFRRANAYYKSLGYEDYWDYTDKPGDTIYEELIIVE